MVTGIARRQEAFRGIRPLNPARDLRAVAELLRIAFQDELGQREVAWLQEMETLGTLPPLAWLMGQVSTALGGVLTGFVWEEDGRITGNVTISRLSADNWLISNVAVHPDHRRQGIARRLMETALEWLRDRDARWVLLQVRHDNVAAKTLYLDLGFVVVDTTMEMRCWGVREVIPVPLPAEYLLRSWQVKDGPRAFALAQEVISELAQEITPLRRQDYEASWAGLLIGQVTRFLGLATTLRWVVEENPDRQLVATLKVRAGYRHHNIDLMVHPRARGRLERSLVSRGLAALHGRRGDVHTQVDATHTAAVETLMEYGFEEVRTLDRMALRLKPVQRIPVR